MRILVTGANGQLGQEFKNNIYKSAYKFYFTDLNELDVTKKIDILNLIINNTIDLIINCAAYTDVNQSEINIEQAKELNVNAVRNLVEVC